MHKVYDLDVGTSLIGHDHLMLTATNASLCKIRKCTEIEIRLFRATDERRLKICTAHTNGKPTYDPLPDEKT
jgi:hypothetical protein